MTSKKDTARGRSVVSDTLPGEEPTPVAPGAEVAPGVTLDPETRQPMDMPPGAEPPPTAPPDMLGLPEDTPPEPPGTRAGTTA